MNDLQKLSKFFGGDTITILAGLEKQRFLIHEIALKLSGSDSLQNLTSESWIESKHRIIDWSHTDAATVARICTFLYTGDYETPQPVPRTEPQPVSAKEKDGDEEDRLDLRTVAGSEYNVQSQFIPQDALAEAVIPEVALLEEVIPEAALPVGATAREATLLHSNVSDPNLRRTVEQSFDARPLTPISRVIQQKVTSDIDAKFDTTQYPYAQYYYENTLLAHARLYAFARYHLCPMLANLALQRLVETLNRVECEEGHSTSEIAALAEFVYTNVATEGVDQDLLRKVVSHFIAANLTTLARGDVANALALGGDLTSDVMCKVARRLRADANRIKGLQQGNADLNQKIQSLTVPKEAVKDEDEDDWGFNASNNRRRGRR